MAAAGIKGLTDWLTLNCDLSRPGMIVNYERMKVCWWGNVSILQWIALGREVDEEKE